MKLSKSKLALAKLINENGGWVDGAKFSSQDKDGNEICFYSNSKPIKPLAGMSRWRSPIGTGYMGGYSIASNTLLKNWHQTCISREEYYQAYPEVTEKDAGGLAEAINLIDGGAHTLADADGWIEWKGGECPVGESELVDYKLLSGSVVTIGEIAGDLKWPREFSTANIIAYRLHKPEVKPELCESVTRSIPEPESKQTIEQLAQDYRNKLDYANRKRKEADDAKSDADAALGELERAGDALGLLIGIAKSEPGLEITKRHQLKLGDVIWIGKSKFQLYEERLPSGEYVVVKLGTIGLLHNEKTFYPDFSARDWKFIRRQ